MADNVRIMLDAGHGGSDPGACYGTRKESKDVLKLVLAIGKRLANDYTNAVIGYTRKTDIFESVTKKRKDSDNFYADFLFAFHRNSYNKKAKGFETLYYSHSEVKDSIMEDIADEMKELGFEIRGNKCRKDLGILKANAPALLFEVGFIDNKGDNKIFDKKFDAIVEAFVRVIAKNCGLKKRTSGKKFAVGNYNAYVEITKECAVRKGRGKGYKKLGTLKKGTRVKVLYIAKNAAGNLWASIDYGDSVGYIYLGNCKPAY